MSTEYISALGIVLVSVLHLFKINIGNDVGSALIIGVLGLVNAIRRYKRGDINVLGARV